MPSIQGFISFIWSTRPNRLYLMIGLMVSIISWILLKVCFPNTFMVVDSYYYIMAALENDPVHIWPIGYSRFLQLIGLISHSANFLAASQYFFLQLALLVFFFAIRYLIDLGRNASIALFLFLFLNPIYAFTGNYIMSDELFMGISLLWLVNLLWIMFEPRHWMLLTQAILLFLAFTIRQSALVYPLVGSIGILLSRQRLSFKIGGIALPCLLVGAFILYSTRMNESRYGVGNFSPFQGWYTANNALYIYAHVPPEKKEPVPLRFKRLDTIVRKVYSVIPFDNDITRPTRALGSYYIFVYPSPLLVYENKMFPQDHHPIPINPEAFAKLGPFYGDYGSFIIRKYPAAFVKYFVFPNISLYIYPFPEVYLDDLGSFSLRNDTLGTITQKWFGPISTSAPLSSIRLRRAIFGSYQDLFAVTHILFILSFLAFISLKGFKKVSRQTARLLLFLGIFWLIQFGFTIVTSVSVFRYQLFITVVEFSLLSYFIDFFVKTESSQKIFDHKPLLPISGELN